MNDDITPTKLLEAKKYIRTKKKPGPPPRGLKPAIALLKEQQKLAAKKAQAEVVAGPNGNQPDLEKLEDFTQELFNNGFNLTQATLTVYPKSSVLSAGARGQQLFALAKKYGLVQMAMEKKGYGLGKMVDIALKNVETSRKPEWWDRLMRMGGFDDFIGAQDKGPAVNVNVIQTHRKDVDSFGFADEAEVVPAQNDNS